MPKFWNKLKPLPIAKLFLKATDVDEVVDEVAAEKVAEGVTIGMATALANLQELRGRKIRFTHEITIDEVLGDTR